MVRSVFGAKGERNASRPGVEQETNQSIDPRFREYMALYNNLDNLIWKIPGYLMAGGLGAIGFLGSYLTANFRDLSPEQISSLAVLTLLLTCLIWLATFSIWQIRKSHTSVGDYLKNMEAAGGFDGYFGTRPSLDSDGLFRTRSSVSVVIWFFNILSLPLFVLALALGVYALSLFGWESATSVIICVKDMIGNVFE